MKKAKITDKSKFAQRMKKEFLEGLGVKNLLRSMKKLPILRNYGGDRQNISCWQQRQ
jgi:hypothetical protein